MQARNAFNAPPSALAMVSWVPQILVPPLVALAFLRSLPRNWVMWMAPTTFLADLDYFIPESWAHGFGLDHFHRVVTHTLLVPALVLAGLVIAWRKKARGSPFWDYARSPRGPLAALLLVYYLAAHAVMDVFTGGVVLFWPFSNLNVYVDAQIVINLQTGQILPTVEPGTSQGPFQLDQEYPWFTNEHAAMLALVLVVLLALLGRWLWRARRELRGPGQGADGAGSPEPSTKGK